MADSTYLKNTVEPFIMHWVSRHIGVELQPRCVPVGPRKDGTLVHFEFDGVSECGQIGVLVSASHSVKAGAVHKLHVDASILLRAAFERRIMAFVSEDVRQNFLNKSDGLLELSRIEMLVCDELTPEMRAGIAKFQAVAKPETGDRGKQWKFGGKRRRAYLPEEKPDYGA